MEPINTRLLTPSISMQAPVAPLTTTIGEDHTMNHIRTVLVAATLAFGTTAVASAQQATPTTPQPRAEHQHHRAGRHGPGMRLRKQLFEGITLSSTEQANVRAVQARYASQMKALREQSRPQLEAARAARQRGDTAAFRHMWKQTAAQRQQTRKLMEQERTDLRAALAPANQTRFDANVAKLRQRMADRARKFGNRRAAKNAGQPNAVKQ